MRPQEGVGQGGGERAERKDMEGAREAGEAVVLYTYLRVGGERVRRVGRTRVRQFSIHLFTLNAMGRYMNRRSSVIFHGCRSMARKRARARREASGPCLFFVLWGDCVFLSLCA